MISILIYLVLLALSIGAYTFFSLRQDGWRKWFTPLGLAGVLIGSVLLLTQTLGRPIPVWASFMAKPVSVVGLLFDKPRAIYVLGRDQESGELVLYQLPWQEEGAKELAEQAEEHGTGALTYDPNEGDQEDYGFRLKEKKKSE